MSVDTRSAGERPDGLLLLIEKSLIRQSCPSPFCATLPFCFITQGSFFWDVIGCFDYFVSAPSRVADKVDVTYRLGGNVCYLRIPPEWNRREGGRSNREVGRRSPAINIRPLRPAVAS